MNFGGLDAEYGAYETARFAVLPVPYDLTSTYQSGSRQGPAAILAASANMELYDEELEQETYRKGIYTAPPVDIDGRGPEYMMSAVERAISGLLAEQENPRDAGR